MVGSYVRWYGRLAKILHESGGYATIKVVKTKQERSVLLLELQPINMRIVEKREESRKPNTFPHWG